MSFPSAGWWQAATRFLFAYVLGIAAISVIAAPVQQEILLWAAILLTGFGLVVLSIWLRRKRQRARWRAKRPIHVRVQQDRPTARQNASEHSAV